MNNQEFHTFRDDMKKLGKNLTASMEDYLEMIYRISSETGYTRIFELSEALHVQPPSATKMVQKLAELKLLKYERYGIIMLENKGIELGKILLNRHTIIEKFLKILDINKNKVLKETEKIEHTISSETLEKINIFIKFIDDNANIIKDFEEYKKRTNN